MNDSLAFLADWGNAELHFEQPGASTHFIITALIVPPDALAATEAQLETVRQSWFGPGPIDWNSLGENQRPLALEQVLAVPFALFALVVDKRELSSEGFYYQGSFYKFLHGLADRELFRSFPNLTLTARQRGEEGFMAGFVRYVHQRHIPTLFEAARFRFAPAPSSLLLQAADLVAQALAHCYDQTVRPAPQPGLRQLLSAKLLQLTHWPAPSTPLLAPPLSGQSAYDAELAELCVGLAQDFVQRHAGSLLPQINDQVSCAQYLVFGFRHLDPARYIASRELMAHLGQRRGQMPTLHHFQTRVIAPLRDAGVLIASSSQGYKIPACAQDLYDFVDHSNTIIQPLLTRIGKCRNRIQLATRGRLDILERAEYAGLQQLLDSQRVVGLPSEDPS